jgi:hypothetical protein
VTPTSIGQPLRGPPTPMQEAQTRPPAVTPTSIGQPLPVSPTPMQEAQTQEAQTPTPAVPPTSTSRADAKPETSDEAARRVGLARLIYDHQLKFSDCRRYALIETAKKDAEIKAARLLFKQVAVHLDDVSELHLLRAQVAGMRAQQPGVYEATEKLCEAGLDDIFSGIAFGVNNGAIRIRKGNHRITALYLQALSRCVSVKTVNSWGPAACFSYELKIFFVAMRLQESAGAAMRLARGPMGEGENNRAQKVTDARSNDDQVTRMYEGAFLGEEFKVDMLEDNFLSDVLCMDAIGGGHLAWIMPGLTRAERSARLFIYQYWAASLWGDALYTPGPRGINSARGARIQGFVTVNLLEMFANADARALLLRSLSDEDLRSWVEKSWIADDIEGQHSDLVRRAGGYKPNPAVCETVLKSVDALSAIKQLPDKEIYINASKKKAYDSADAATEVLSKWNDGTALLPTSSALKKFDAMRQANMNEAAKGHQKTWREFHKVRTTARTG